MFNNSGNANRPKIGSESREKQTFFIYFFTFIGECDLHQLGSFFGVIGAKIKQKSNHTITRNMMCILSIKQPTLKLQKVDKCL